MNSRVKNLLFWVVVGLFMILLFNLFSVPTHAPEEEVIFSDFMAKLDKGEVTKVTIKANHISAILKDGAGSGPIRPNIRNWSSIFARRMCRSKPDRLTRVLGTSRSW